MISEYLIKKAGGSAFSTLMDVVKKNPYIIAGGGLGMGAGVWAGNQLSKDEEDPEGTWTGRILGGLTGTALGAVGGNALLHYLNLKLDAQARIALANSDDNFDNTPEGLALLNANTQYSNRMDELRASLPSRKDITAHDTLRFLREAKEARKAKDDVFDRAIEAQKRYLQEYQDIINSKYGELF